MIQALPPRLRYDRVFVLQGGQLALRPIWAVRWTALGGLTLPGFDTPLVRDAPHVVH